MNQTLLEKVRCMLSNAGLGKQFWAEAVMYASHLINRLPSAAVNGKTPLEVWSKKPANDYDTLRVFGSTAYYHVKESKLDPRAKTALFMGVTSGVKGYRLWCLSSKKIISSRDVTFDESVMLKKVTTDGKVSENTFQQPEGRLPQVEGTQKLVEFQTTSVKTINPTKILVFMFFSHLHFSCIYMSIVLLNWILWKKMQLMKYLHEPCAAFCFCFSFGCGLK